MIKINDEYKKAAYEFKKAFGYGVPLRMIPQSESTENLIANIHKCVDAKTDLLPVIYHMKLSDDTHY